MDKKSLNPQQEEAVRHGAGPLLIIAGAGTGKTTVITERIIHLIKNKNILPSEILALTFTDKAALEMETRIDSMMPYGYSQLWIETFHAFCDRILRQEGINIGIDPSFKLLTEAQSLLFLKKNIFELDLDYFRPLGNPTKFLQGMVQHFSRLRDDDISSDDYLLYAKKLYKKNINNHDSSIISEIKKTSELANAFKKYEDLKNKEGIMDFSDLISNTLKLFRTRKNILSHYQEKFKFILVDEFQDTNYAQNEMAILLAGNKKNITVVGDDDQAIYRWRGAALSNMLQFKSHFPEAKIISLTTNYRSTQTILNCAYKMIQNNNPDRLEIKENINKKLVSSSVIKESEVELLYGKDGNDEADLIIEKIKQEIKQNNRRFKDFAILVRANDHSLIFQRKLEQSKIPFQFLGPGRLFQQEEIKDLIAYLKILVNFDDQASLYRVITNPIFSIEPRDIAVLMSEAKKTYSLFHALEKYENLSLIEDSKIKIKKILEMIKKHLSLVPKESAGQILFGYFEDSGLLGYYLDPRSQKTETEAQNIAMFFEKIQSYSSSSTNNSIFSVVDWIDMSMELGESPLAASSDWSENNAVNILTVHSSKGLEFPVVFITNLVTLRFPSRDRKEQIPVPHDLIREDLPKGDENLQEERRLFYVAATRAKQKLFLTAARFYNDGKRERKLSPFVHEALDDKYVNKIIDNQKITDSSQQLSLLETLRPVIKNESSKISEHKNGQLNFNNNLSSISFSQIQTFDMCPLHYKLKYLMKLPSTASPALSFGTTIHAVLKKIYMMDFHKNNISHKEIEEIVNTSWMNEGYSNYRHSQDSKKSAVNLIEKYIMINKNENTSPEETELSFNFYINNTKVLGRFDRIDKLDDGKIEIIDYKTGKNIPDDKKIAKDLQLTLYALAVTKINLPLFTKNPEDILLTLYYIEENKKISTTRTKQDLIEAEEYIKEKIKEIENSDFKCKGGIFCQHCEYNMLCMTHK